MGSHAAGTLQIDPRAINEVLAMLAGHGATAPRLELQPHNVVMVRYGMLHARAELPRLADAPQSGQVTVVLASLVVAWALKAAVRQPFIHVHGRRLTIDMAAVPAFASWRDLWRYLQQLTFETTPGALRVGFTLAVHE
jgi:hypothetical protein